MEIIVISIAQYKEKDAVINVITDGRAFSFYARGILNPKNKNSFLNCILCKANITLIEGKLKYPILESAELITSPMMSNNSLNYLNSILSIDEAMVHLFDEEEKFLGYSYVNNALTALRKGKNPFVAVFYFLMKILPCLGFELEVKQCVNCGSKKDITDFSFIEGGFLCRKCSENSNRRYNNDQLLLIRNIVLSNEVEAGINIKDEDVKELLFDINTFLTDGIGYHIKTLDSLLK